MHTAGPVAAPGWPGGPAGGGRLEPGRRQGRRNGLRRCWRGRCACGGVGGEQEEGLKAGLVEAVNRLLQVPPPPMLERLDVLPRRWWWFSHLLHPSVVVAL